MDRAIHNRHLRLAALLVVLEVLSIHAAARWAPLFRHTERQLRLSSPEVLTEEIPLAEPVELDFESRTQILKLRRRAVLGHRRLLRRGYLPSAAVVGEIEDGRPWWGIDGIYGRGAGLRSIEGPSEESRFLLNPFLLVGLQEPLAVVLRGKPQPLYPRPDRLRWRLGRRPSVRVSYDVRRYFALSRRLRIDWRAHDSGPRDLLLAAYNARDLGLNYLYLDPERSRDVHALHQGAVKIRQWIHRVNSLSTRGAATTPVPNSQS